MLDKYEHEFRWDSDSPVPSSVIVTGTFDDWKLKLHLTKGDGSEFSGKVYLDYGSRVLYKYVVDGNWRTHPNEPEVTDAAGITNNVLTVPENPAKIPALAPTAEPVTTTSVSASTAPYALTANAGTSGSSDAALSASVVAGKEVTKSADDSMANEEEAQGTKELKMDMTPSPSTAPNVNALSSPVAALAQLSAAADKSDKGYLEAGAGAAVDEGLISAETGKATEEKAKVLDAQVASAVVERAKAKVDTAKEGMTGKANDLTANGAVTVDETKEKVSTSAANGAEASAGIFHETGDDPPAQAKAVYAEMGGLVEQMMSTAEAEQDAAKVGPATIHMEEEKVAPSVVPTDTKHNVSARSFEALFVAPDIGMATMAVANGVTPFTEAKGSANAAAAGVSKIVPASLESPTTHSKNDKALPVPHATPVKSPSGEVKDALKEKGAPHLAESTPLATPDDSFKTAPSTPDGTPSRKRKQSLFHKIKKALSPNKSPGKDKDGDKKASKTA